MTMTRREQLELLRTSRFPPGGENYWLEIEKLVESAATTFIQHHSSPPFRFRKHSDTPRWFLIDGEVNNKPAKRIQITLRGEPGRFILSLIPDATIVRENRRFTLRDVDPEKYVQIVQLKGGVEWQPIEALGNLQDALNYALKDAEELAEREESDFSIPLP